MNKLLNQQLDDLLRNSTVSTYPQWLSALRIAAGTLCRTAPNEITATTVVCDADGADLDTVERVVQEIADDYGLEASIQQQPGSYAVRFSWPEWSEPSKPHESMTSNKSLLPRFYAFARHWLEDAPATKERRGDAASRAS